MMRFATILWTLLLLPLSATAVGQRLDSPSSDEFALVVEPPMSLRPRLSRIAALLVEQCVGCHNAQQTEGGYSMATPMEMTAPGESRELPIRLDLNLETQRQLGEIYRRVISQNSEERMPKDGPPLDWEDTESIREWLAFGAYVDGASDAPLESFVPTTIATTPRWETYPRPQSVGAIALDADSRTLFSGGAQEILVWNWDGKLLGRIPTRGRFVSDLEWNPAAGCICFSSGDPGRLGYVESVPWLHETGETVESSRVVHWVARDVPLDIAVSSRGDRLAIGTQEGMVVVTLANASDVVWKSSAHAAAVTSLDWSSDDALLVSSSRDRMAKSFDAQTGEPQTNFVDHERTVTSIRSLNIGCVSMDEAGVLRVYPGGTSANPRANRGGFAQQTPKMASNRDMLLVPVEGAIRRFQFRTEEVVESKGEDGKEKKKTNWIIDEIEPLRLQVADASEVPLSVTLAAHGSHAVAAGLASGVILLWVPEEIVPIRFLNQPH
jgi:hypothetical protein